MKFRMILVMISILLISTLLLQEPISYVVSAQGTETIYYMDPDIDCLHLVSNTNFTEPPSHGINGTSGEFSTSFHTNVGSNTINYVELKWEHQPGGSLELRNNYSIAQHEPDSWDYSYISFPFEWSYEILPVSCLSLLEFEVECTGDFLTEILGPSMFEVCVLLIDSGNQFARLQTQEYLGNASYGYYSNQLSSWIIEYGWGGMIEDETGHQDAPNDTAEIRIALTPSDDFFSGADPAVDNYDGAVTIRCKYVDVQVLADVPPESNPVTPLAVGSVGTNASVNFMGMAVSPNKSMFSLGRTYTDPKRGIIVKWGNNAKPQWVQEWRDNETSGIAATNETLYTVGQQNDDISLGVWLYNGELLANLLFNINGSDYGVHVDVLVTGEIIILGCSYHDFAFHPFLMKLHHNYSVDWKIFGMAYNYEPRFGLEVSEDGTIYVQIGEVIDSVTSDGTVSSTDLDFSAQDFQISNDGYIWFSGVGVEYTQPMQTLRRDLSISKILFPHPDTMITSNVRYKYSPVFFDSNIHSNIAIDDEEESIYVLSQKGVRLFFQSIITKVDHDCSIIWCASIQEGGGGSYQDDWNFWNELEVLEDNRICVAGNDFPGEEMKLTFAIFDFNILFNEETIDWILVGAIAGAVVIADVAIIYYMKRRKPQPPKKKVDLDEVFDDLFENS